VIDGADVRAPTIRVEGKGKVKELDKLDIDARLAIAPSLEGRLPNEIAQNFQPLAGDADWKTIEFTIGGTLRKPKTDLQKKLAKRAAIQMLGNILGDLLTPPKSHNGAPAVPGTPPPPARSDGAPGARPQAAPASKG
jgi:hypothetical protein